MIIEGDIVLGSTEVASVLLKHTLFAGDTAKAETIWRSQRAEVKDSWRARADAFLADLAERGYVLVKEERS